MKYTVEWTDGEIEVYESKGEQMARIHKLEEQGYEMGEDFTIGILFD